MSTPLTMIAGSEKKKERGRYYCSPPMYCSPDKLVFFIKKFWILQWDGWGMIYGHNNIQTCFDPPWGILEQIGACGTWKLGEMVL